MRNLITRSISGLVYAIIFIAAILFSAESYIVLIAIFSAICVFEFSRILQLKNIVPYVLLVAIIYVATIKILLYIDGFLIGFSLVGLVGLLYYLLTTKPIKTTTTLQKIFLHSIYLILPFYFLIKLPFIQGNYHPNIIIYIILLIWTNDSFAFLVGKNFGKHKLFEAVSPKKTIEGFIGGVLFAVLGAVLIGKFGEYPNSFSILNWIFIAIIVAVFGSLGDLVESKFKRQANIKDSGTIMPGHGGLLDRLDSLFFLAPFVYLYIHYIL
ncbi:phosphatidate cytidylyltransferase [Tenacibaculum finnmarkense]|uniref:phosphatidate cytidylyltransferase n=1 Tax=Tenacibaculum finnmarkense TaxID=2781243 RepID=UPI001EFBF574|nr:phosphatidate cytidylyltransferase [Tenacibaculum finnmarkense]MCG8207149.1 phosphatidate cytidylyltransferase [Tenacibaculum finnmarkense genomovar finnmarkense]MCG8722650.1 phosphatidate cytidylyltransferase [Tenacibaculum finnmarkense]MCG8741571.1 phosphatidate cytidylyltransferase [Tenacibaculum finnmarkense]MCG8764869.1 phosphatidate cytidylyltransferase [Tenacibaculum finnmarkense]MCG8777872.1 phosphatidate cytidylyltransferase [Tenacibaculum finnmarkense]